jgi:hypothetical protein
LILIFLCLNATFNNISAISWRPVLLVEDAGVLAERTIDHGQATGKLFVLRRDNSSLAANVVLLM